MIIEVMIEWGRSWRCKSEDWDELVERGIFRGCEQVQLQDILPLLECVTVESHELLLLP